jgi:phage terminase large subunit-like protein
MFVGSGERGATCLTAANTRDQALITYEEARNMLEHLQADSKKAQKLIKIMANLCLVPSKKNVLKAMAADPKKLDGYKPSFVSIDETHEMKTNKIIKIFERAVAQKTEPLIAISSTVGYNTTYPFYNYYRMCERILEQVLDDDSLFIDMYAMDEEDDWNDPKNWGKPNPMLGKIINRDNFAQDYNSARNEGGTSEIDFQVKNLNKWCGTAKTWISSDIIKGCNFNFEVKSEEVCHVGVDLATVDDIAVVSVLFPPTETCPKFRFRNAYFIPEESIDARTEKHGVPYRQWANEGRFNVIPKSNVIDQTYIEKYIVKEICEKYQVETIDIDRWNAVQFAGNLSREGLEVGFYGQGFRGMNEPTKLLEKLYKSSKIDNGSDRIFEWMMSNIVLATDAAGSVKPDKDKSTEKIDGVSALLTAFGGYIRSSVGKEESIYEHSGIRRLTD